MIATGNERPTDLAFIVIYKKLKDNKRRLVEKCEGVATLAELLMKTHLCSRLQARSFFEKTAAACYGAKAEEELERPTKPYSRLENPDDAACWARRQKVWKPKLITDGGWHT